MIRSNLCDYTDAYLRVKGNITGQNTGIATAPDNKKVTFKNCTLFINCISEINNAQVDDAHDVDIIMSMYKLIEYSDTCLKISGNIWQY